MTRVIIGAGLIGAGLAEGALARGEHVVIWNRTRSRAEATGAQVADSIEDAVKGAQVVQVVLTADAAVDAVLPAIYEASPDILVVDHSTTSVASTGERARRLAAEGKRYLHAPVFMNPVSCRAAKGTVVASGPAALFEQARPLLEPMTGKVLYLGEREEAAAAMKLVGNAMIIQTVAAMADVFRLADAVGIPREQAHALLDTVSPANVVKGRGKRMLDGDPTPHWSLAMARKDVGLMLEAGAHTPLLSALAAEMDAVIMAQGGEDDLAILGIEKPAT